MKKEIKFIFKKKPKKGGIPATEKSTTSIVFLEDGLL